jgi:hypothetical protein
MTDPLRDNPSPDDHDDLGQAPADGLMDARCFVLVAAAVAVGVLLYLNRAGGLAVLGGVTLLAALARLVRR